MGRNEMDGMEKKSSAGREQANVEWKGKHSGMLIP